VLCGNLGNGGCSIANLCRKDGTIPFNTGDQAAPITHETTHQPSKIKGWDVYDTPGLDLVTEKRLHNILLDLNGPCKLCFVMAPRAGRLRLEDIGTMQRLMDETKCNTCGVIVNFFKDISYQKDFEERLLSDLGIPPNRILFIPATEDLQAHADALIRVCFLF
jgi:hypothetical protein